MATLKELKAEAQKALGQYHDLNKRIEKLRKKMRERKQAACKHEKTYTTSEPDYYEPGRMSHQTYTKYEVCANCKMRLAVLAPEFKWRKLDTKTAEN